MQYIWMCSDVRGEHERRGPHKTLVNRFWGNTTKYIVCPKEITTAKQHSPILMRSAQLTQPCKVSCADLFSHM